MSADMSQERIQEECISDHEPLFIFLLKQRFELFLIEILISMIRKESFFFHPAAQAKTS